MIPAISQVSTLHASFNRDLEDYSAGKCPAVEIWLTKLEQHLQDHSTDQVVQRLEELELQPAAASFHGGLFSPQPERQDEAWRLLEERVPLCGRLGVPTIVIAADLAPPLTQSLIDQIPQTLRRLAELGARAGIRMALEFQHGAVFMNNLQTAAAIVEECGSPHVGICLDAFHFGVGRSKIGDLSYLTPDNLFHVQLCDVADVARELATDSDRILPGEGDLPVPAIIDHLKAIDYSGYVSVEVMNPQLWQVPPREFGEIATTSLRTLLGQAESSG